MATLKNIAGFQETKEMVTVTLNGWDGKTYNGEGRNLRVWTLASEPGKKFVKVNFSYGRKGQVPCFHILTGHKHEVTGVEIAEFYYSVD